ncbi:MAG: hypothetical protein AB8G95_07135 [Anaerolineae bacterium]
MNLKIYVPGWLQALLIWSVIAFVISIIMFPTPPAYPAGTSIHHDSEKFNFTVPNGISNTNIYDLGKYNRDKNIIVRMSGPKGGGDGFSITVRKFEKGSNQDFFTIVNKHQGAYETPRWISPYNLGTTYKKQPLGNSNGETYGWRIDTFRRVQGTVVYVNRESDVLIISYAAAEQFYKPNLKGFEAFLLSINLD